MLPNDISSKLSKVSDIKKGIRTAANTKGANIKASDPFEAYAGKIQAIPQDGTFGDFSEPVPIGMYNEEIVYKMIVPFETGDTPSVNVDIPYIVKDATSIIGTIQSIVGTYTLIRSVPFTSTVAASDSLSPRVNFEIRVRPYISATDTRISIAVSTYGTQANQYLNCKGYVTLEFTMREIEDEQT